MGLGTIVAIGVVGVGLYCVVVSYVAKAIHTVNPSEETPIPANEPRAIREARQIIATAWRE